MFILSKDFNEENQNDLAFFDSRFSEYINYLDSIKESFPKSAREFALADWRLDYTDHRNPHDSWVENCRIFEESSGERKEIRVLHIETRLLGAYHDGFLDLKYLNVATYSLTKTSSFGKHDDWLYDEVRLSENNLVLHEIDFASGASWLIECDDIEFNWKPFENEITGRT